MCRFSNLYEKLKAAIPVEYLVPFQTKEKRKNTTCL
jgi:hypothetical protein